MERDRGKGGDGRSDDGSASSVGEGVEVSAPTTASANDPNKEALRDPSGVFPSSGKHHRREALLLDDSELFMFDFSDPTAIPPAEEVMSPSDEVEEPPSVGTTTLQTPFIAPAGRVLGLAEVRQHAEEALSLGALEFMRPPTLHRDGSAGTLGETIERFVTRLRRYDEGLWRAHKAQTEGGRAGAPRRRPRPTPQEGDGK
ncbi:unnamed protein product [Phytomonas sp. Hart1]|nr:unnamed protein product [Phytomonas sp. Hart1]|eukprot:CCW67498.1 unnamed protein product [Phytomonas sp. isolate Hart1]